MANHGSPKPGLEVRLLPPLPIVENLFKMNFEL